VRARTKRLGLAGVTLVACALASAPAGAAPWEQRLIRPAVGIGKLRLGMTEAQVRRAMGKPRFVVRRPGAFGVQVLEYQYGLAEYTVRLFGRAGRLRAVRVGTTLVRERTPRGLGVGSLERAVRRAYPSIRCQPLRTQRSGTVLLVVTIQRECTVLAPSGRRTIFTTDVYERMFEVITPAIWARRARVIEVSVAAPA
jgi:hypothetical protein